jgi:hypothetical protein
VESELKLDGSTKYVTGRGVVLKGQQYFLERYQEKDPNIPKSGPEKLVGLLSQTKKIWDNLKVSYKSATKWLDDQLGDITIAFSPSGATLQYDATGDAGEVDLIGFQYRAVDPSLAWPFMLPVSVAGRADVPHNGIGGFFSLFPYQKTLVRPATLTIRWLDPEVAGLDENSIRVYGWDDAEGEWRLVGGTVNAAENSVSVQITRFGMFTAAPAMPVGEPTVLATITSPGSQGQPTRATFTSETVQMNTGVTAPDGTLFTVYVTTGTADDPVSIGTILEPDLDPALEGVQVASAGGVVRFTAEFPAALGDGKVLMWSARGGTVFVDQDLLLAPPQP